MTEQKPMTTAGVTTTQAEPAKAANEAEQKRLDEATSHMTDHSIAERVRAYHPHASASDEGTKAMLADYDRLKGEADKAKAPAPAEGAKPA